MGRLRVFLRPAVGEGETLAGGGMVVEEELDPRRWRKLRQILVRQPRHRALESVHLAGQVERIAIGLALHQAAEAVVEWQDQQSEDAEHSGEQGHRRWIR